MSLAKYLPSLIARGVAVSYEFDIRDDWSEMNVHLIVPDQYDRQVDVSIIGSSIIIGDAVEYLNGVEDDFCAASFQVEDLSGFVALSNRIWEINEWLTKRYAA